MRKRGERRGGEGEEGGEGREWGRGRGEGKGEEGGERETVLKSGGDTAQGDYQLMEDNTLSKVCYVYVCKHQEKHKLACIYSHARRHGAHTNPPR